MLFFLSLLWQLYQVCGNDRTVAIVSLSKGQVEAKLVVGGSGSLRSVAWLHDTVIIVPLENGLCKVINLDGKVLNEFRTLPFSVHVSLCPREKRLICANSESIAAMKLPEVMGAHPTSHFSEIKHHALSCCGVAFSADGSQLVTGDIQGHLIVSEVRSGRSLCTNE